MSTCDLSKREMSHHSKVHVRFEWQGQVFSNCLVDTGAGVSLLPSTLARKETLEPIEGDIELLTAAGGAIPVLGQITVDCALIGADDKPQWTGKHTFFVADIITGPVLGADFLDKHQMDIRFSTGLLSFSNGHVPLIAREISRERRSVVLSHDVRFDDGTTEVMALGRLCRQGEGTSRLSPCALFSPKKELEHDVGILIAHSVVDASSGEIPIRMLATTPHASLRKGKVVGYVDEEVDMVAFCNVRPAKTRQKPVNFDLSKCTLSGDHRQSLEALLTRYEHIFSTGDDDLGRTDLVQHDIPTGNVQPIHKRNYRQAFHLRKEADRQVETLLQNGVIEQSKSPWSSPVLMVPKKDGSYRFCVDFRGLNAVSEKSEYPLPRVDESLEAMAGACLFTTLDLAAGYWQVELNPADRAKTAFSTSSGHYEFVTMPMGLKGAPATFQRLMDLVMRGLKWETLLIYLDDILVFGRTPEEHLTRLEEVFQRLADAGLKLKPSKCCFGQSVVRFLGHIVSASGVATDPEKLKQVLEWPEPKNVTALRAFLGLTGYYRRFIQHYAEKAAPLTALTSKKRRFCWTTAQADSFRRLKEELCTSPVLQYPVFDSAVPFILKTDASDIAAGAVLCQRQDDRGERVIAYGSRKFNPAEQKYPAHERELAAVVWAMKHFRPYLYGQRFIVVTDNEPITYLKTMKDPRGRLARWLQEICSFDFEICYKPGKHHKDADALSRHPEHLSATPRIVAATFLGSDEDRLKQAQQADPVISCVLDQLATGKAPGAVGEWRKGALRSFRRIWSQLKLSQGILVRLRHSDKKELSVLPTSLRKEALCHLHDDPTSGHMGVEKTSDKVRDRFYWPGYSNDIEQYVLSCAVCQERTAATPRPCASLVPISVCRPFQMVAMDFGPELPKSLAGNKYYLVISDYYTKWPEVVAVPDQKASTVAHALVQELIPRHGVPEILHSDQGKAFESEVIKELCSILGIKKVRTSPYHPQSDGLVERLNRTLLQMLSKYVSDSATDWDLWLNSLLGAYRTSRHASTGFSPFTLLYGRDARFPADVSFSTTVPHGTMDYEEYIRQLQRVGRISQETVEDNVAMAQARQVAVYGGGTIRHFQVGTKVLWYNPALRRGPGYKLRRPWSGPFIVLAKTSPVNYQIQKVGAPRSKKRIVHFNSLKQWRERPEPSSSSDVTHSEADPSEDEFYDHDSESDIGFYQGSCGELDSDSHTEAVTTTERPRRMRRQPKNLDDFYLY